MDNINYKLDLNVNGFISSTDVSAAKAKQVLGCSLIVKL